MLSLLLPLLCFRPTLNTSSVELFRMFLRLCGLRRFPEKGDVHPHPLCPHPPVPIPSVLVPVPVPWSLPFMGLAAAFGCLVISVGD